MEYPILPELRNVCIVRFDLHRIFRAHSLSIHSSRGVCDNCDIAVSNASWQFLSVETRASNTLLSIFIKSILTGIKWFGNWVCVKMPNYGEISESSSLQHRNGVKRFLIFSHFPTFPNSFPTFPNIDFCLKPKAMCPVLVCQIPDAADAGWL